MRNTRRDIETLDLAGKDSETALLGSFFTAIEEALGKAKMPRNGTPALMRSMNVERTFISSSAQHLSEVTYAGSTIFEARSSPAASRTSS